MAKLAKGYHTTDLATLRLTLKSWRAALKEYPIELVVCKHHPAKALPAICKNLPNMLGLSIWSANKRMNLDLLAELSRLTGLCIMSDGVIPSSMPALKFSLLPPTLRLLSLHGAELIPEALGSIHLPSLTKVIFLWQETEPSDVWQLVQQLPSLKVNNLPALSCVILSWSPRSYDAYDSILPILICLLSMHMLD